MSEPGDSSADSTDSPSPIPGKWKIGCTVVIALTLILVTIGAVGVSWLTTRSREGIKRCAPRPSERITVTTRSLDSDEPPAFDFVVQAPVESTPSAGVRWNEPPDQRAAVGRPVISPDGRNVAVPITWSRASDSAVYPYAGSLFVVSSDGSYPRDAAVGLRQVRLQDHGVLARLAGILQAGLASRRPIDDKLDDLSGT